MSYTRSRVQLGPSVEGLGRSKRKDDVSERYNGLQCHPSLAYLTLGRTASAPSSISTSTFVQGSEGDTNSTAAYLKSLSETMLSILCNERDLAHPLLKKHISPAFLAKQDDRENSTGLGEHLSIWTHSMKDMPDYRYEIVESIAEMHENGKNARVWSFKRLSGLPVETAIGSRATKCELKNGICKESVDVLYWELQGTYDRRMVKGDIPYSNQGTGQLWVCARMKMMEGVSGVA